MSDRTFTAGEESESKGAPIIEAAAEYPIYRACPIAIDCGGWYITDRHQEPVDFMVSHFLERHPQILDRHLLAQRRVENVQNLPTTPKKKVI